MSKKEMVKTETEQSLSYKIHDGVVGNETCLFEITDGKYCGFKYRYGVVSFDDSDSDNPVMKFSYERDESSSKTEVDEELIDIMGKILVEVFDGRYSG